MIKEHRRASLDVFKAAKSIEIATDKIYQHLNLNPKGRLIYVGAGTSGRIGVQDGVELLPTFSWPKSRLDYILAGGDAGCFKFN
jgi:N-acetylmuramic acid 6-phosphate etherase